ncbi:MAG: hypothetical protein KF789_02040 [Bdellovibrionaceae bacterium]|nr:hypothetical protein [Pseudobdellovibrionaceae bacterium]
MTMNPLPPQAYTKETLLRAYHWLQSQAPSIREMAITPDILVSLYLKASRDGDQSLERPSIQNFKTELKNLAGIMGELDAPLVPQKTVTEPVPRAKAPTPPPSVDAPSAAFFQSFAAAQSTLREDESVMPMPPTAPAVPSATPPSMPSTFASPASAAPAAEHQGLGLDGRSLELVREVRRDFNLSSDAEALRMLIQIGSAKAKSLLKS